MNKKIRVLIVDDSKYMRFILKKIISESADLEVVGEARDGVDALLQIPELGPDVVTLDMEMPRMDGMKVLARIKQKYNLPVVILSRYTDHDGTLAVKALEAGAVDVIQNPEGRASLTFDSIREEIVKKIKQASQSAPQTDPLPAAEPAPVPAAAPSPPPQEMKKVLFIGSSMGGPRVLTEIFKRITSDLPLGVIAVQHIPEGFSALLANRLNSLSTLEVREAHRGDVVRPGAAFLAPGGFHLRVRDGGRLYLDKTPPLHKVRPAVDVALKDAARVFGDKLVFMILTGMGCDGADGARAVKEHGGAVLVQDIETCIVHGMPSSVIDTGCADKVAPVDALLEEIFSYL